MKKALPIIVAIAIFFVALSAGIFWYVNRKTTTGYPAEDATWKFAKTIAVPITTQASNSDAILGDLAKDKVSINIPKGAFDDETKIELVTPDTAPSYSSSLGEPIGSPIEIKSSGEKRLNEKMLVSFAFDSSTLPAETYPDQLWISYYNGDRWDYLKPETVDMQNGIVTFGSYHFSLLGLNKVKDETVITEHWIHSKALDDKLRKSINDTTDAVCNKAVELALQKMGINDKGVAGKILSDILTDDSYKEMHDALGKKDVESFNQKLSILLGKKIVDRVPESMFKTGLETLTGDDAVGDVAAVSKAAGYATEGQYKDAVKIIGEQIADKFLLTTAGKIAVQVVDYQIESWKNEEVEAAYLAYRNGSSKIFYGYYNDPKDFDTVWSQMRGIGRQLAIEAIKKENTARIDAGLPPLNDKQMDMVRENIKESYRRQFEKRVKEDEDMEKQEADIRMMVAAYKNAGFLDRINVPAGLDKGFDLDTRLDVLYHFAEKMMNDTNRFLLSDKEGLIMKDKLSVHDIVQGARYYFGGEKGKEDYEKFLADRFGIVLYPSMKELAGTWNKGSMTITDVILSDAAKQAIEDAKNGKESADEGCDFTIDFEKLKGQTQEVLLSLEPTGDASANMTITMGEGDAQTIPVSYKDGVLSGSMSQDGAVGTFSLKATKDKTDAALNGTLTISYKNDMIKIIGSMGVTKTLPTD